MTTLSPTTGPTLGGTPAVMLQGGGRHSLESLTGGPHYRCRFGDGMGGEYAYAPAAHGAEDHVYGEQAASGDHTLTTHGDDDIVFCVAPPGVATNMAATNATDASHAGWGVRVAVSLNGQQFHDLTERYRRLEPPPNSLISGQPTSGPVAGGTLVTMSGCPHPRPLRSSTTL